MNATKTAFVAVVLAVTGALVVAFAPLGTRCRARFDVGDGLAEETCHGVSLFSTDGSWILVVVAVPVTIATLGWLVPLRAARGFAAVLLCLACIIGLASVGMFFVPAAIAMTVAAFIRDRTVVVAG